MLKTDPHHIIATCTPAGGREKIHPCSDHTLLGGVYNVIFQYLSIDLKNRMVDLMAKHSKHVIEQADDEMNSKSHRVYPLILDRAKSSGPGHDLNPLGKLLDRVKMMFERLDALDKGSLISVIPFCGNEAAFHLTKKRVQPAFLPRSLKIFFFVILFGLFFTRSSAQYAIGGTAGPSLYNSVYWLTWDPTAQNSTMISYPAGANGFNILNGTYIWQFSPTVRITAIVSNETFVGGASATMISYTPGIYEHDGLDLMYSSNNQPKPASRGVNNSALSSPYGGQVTFDIDVKVAILINGVYTDVVYPGMVIADAESIDAQGEFISGDTPNPVAWQLLNKRTEGNSADSHYKMDISNSGRSFKLYADLLPGNFGVQAVMFAHGARNLKNLSMKGSGNTAIAVGFVLPFDMSDAPASYGTAGHYMDNFQISDYYGGDGTYAVVNYPVTPLLAKANVYMGFDNVDPDGQSVSSVLATNDDLTGNADESSITPSTLPQIKVNQAGDVSLSIPVTNGKSVPATLYAWIDFNNDGIFASNEVITTTIPANISNQVFVVTFPNSMFTGKLRTGQLYARLRITTTPLTDNTSTTVDERSVSFAADGEAEDYKLNDIVGVSISGTVFNDHNGGLDGTISGIPLQAVGGQQLYAYLVDNTGIIVNKVPVAANGSYTFSNTNTGNYTVAISTRNVVTGSLASTIPVDLPAGWQAAGEAYGINNASNTGIEPGTPNGQILVVTPGTSLDVNGVNFAIDQTPATTPDAGTTNIGVPITIDVPANDSDPDGTLDLTKVLLIDPSDNVKKTSVSIAGVGTYAVNATTGKVTFTPLPTFIGKSSISYTIKDDYGAESPTALISISVKPVGVNDSGQTPANVSITTVVKANDGASATGTTVTAVTPPNHGTIVVNASGSITYTPATAYTGTDSYTYSLTTADGVVSNPITVTITVYSASMSLTKVATNTGTKAGDVINYTLTVTNTGTTALTNIVVTDAGADAGSISPANIATLAGAAVSTVTAKHTLTQAEVDAGSYSNQAGATATDINGNTVTRSKSDDPATTAPDDPTVITIPPTPAITLTKSGALTPLQIVYSFIIKNTGNVTLTTVSLTDGQLKLTNVLVTLPAGGLLPGQTVTFTYSYNLTQADKDAGKVVNTATANARDAAGHAASSASGVTITVPISPVAVNDAATTNANKPVIIAVLTNDNPVSTTFDPTSVEIMTQPAHGKVQVNSDGTITYTPTPGYSGPDTFTYRVRDIYGFYTNIATVTIADTFDADMKIPTLFTPNGDGINDLFEIRGLSQYFQNELTIINRWGNEVYRQNGYQNNWDGNGLNEGTYYYLLRVKQTDGSDWLVYKGYVTLIRTFKK